MAFQAGSGHWFGPCPGYDTSAADDELPYRVGHDRLGGTGRPHHDEVGRRAGGQAVTLSSGIPGRAGVPDGVHIAAGQTSATFPITTTAGPPPNWRARG